ncbi:hypothetical protein LUZ61_007005 [Rhynchospora tenuis]|uniref:Homeobox domain-containing protein n=1 Tax=Rhynchospora tenuis TaxID=198213 RepID=A0AAD6EW77_9POAL|nr:hypothetical protein LUZ61_007005 [Rhynchospora tenuis]
MEEGKNSSVSTTSNPRWNPTKEQISLLENLYRQGVRTPTAEEIQQITGKLREFGSIEGKNVFYWFQNHKARQRQKQKQHTFSYYSRLLQRSPQILSPVVPVPQQNAAVSPPVACNNGVIFRPIYIPPQAGVLNFYPHAQIQVQAQGQNQAQYPSMFLPESSKTSTATVFPTFDTPPNNCAPSNNGCFPNHASPVSIPEVGTSERETLQLFPLYPAKQRSEERLGSSLTLDSASDSLELLDGAKQGEEEQQSNTQVLLPITRYLASSRKTRYIESNKKKLNLNRQLFLKSKALKVLNIQLKADL